MNSQKSDYQFKRYCKTLTLKNDPELIEEYKRVHENVWPEIKKGMREVGILNMEIYIHGNRLFMIMDTAPGFDHDKAMQRLAAKPRQAEWEAHVARFQETTEEASAAEKWQLMERIFKLDQRKEHGDQEK
ncbi:L-rhamnose mutarotase [Halalkalibaculum sp. DA3122]|uniref:L-rhamnose mutarotase n=1 Tax=unclassified Halalkalibaculum TaxID=2964617 RepID=UPI0037544E55